MPNRNPDHMSPEAIVGEITYLRDGIEHSSRRILELSRSMHDRMRRETRARVARNVRPGSPEGDESTRTGIYLTYANLWTRFASMVHQGLQRTRQADRVLRLLPDEQVGPPPQAEEEAQPAASEAQPVPEPTPYDDFIAVYGEEPLRDASAAEQQRDRER